MNFPGDYICLLYTSPSPRDSWASRMPSSAWKKSVRDLKKIFFSLDFLIDFFDKVYVIFFSALPLATSIRKERELRPGISLRTLDNKLSSPQDNCYFTKKCRLMTWTVFCTNGLRLLGEIPLFCFMLNNKTYEFPRRLHNSFIRHQIFQKKGTRTHINFPRDRSSRRAILRKYMFFFSRSDFFKKISRRHQIFQEAWM